MRGKKTKDIDKARVIEAKINNPDKTTREIQEETGVNYRTTARILNKNLSQVVPESTRIAKLIDDNDNLMSLCNVEMIKRVQDTPEELRPLELNTIKDSSFKQNQLLEWKSTDNINVTDTSILENKSLNEIEELRRKLIW